MSFTANMIGISRTRHIGTLSVGLSGYTDFQLQLNSDLENIFFNSNEFAVNTVSYTHYGSGEVKIYNIIPDNPTRELTPGIKSEITSHKPFIRIPTHLLSQTPDSNDEIVWKSIKYYIESTEDDGVGITTFNLTTKRYN